VAAMALLVGWAVVATYGALHHIEHLAHANAPLAAEYLVWLTQIVAFVFTLAVLALGAWIVWVGYRISRDSFFSMPGITLIRTVRPYIGRKARIIGWVAQFIGLAILVLGTMGAWMFVDLAQMLLRG